MLVVIKLAQANFAVTLQEQWNEVGTGCEVSCGAQRFGTELQHQLKYRWLSGRSTIAFSFLSRNLAISSYGWYNPNVMTSYYWFNVVLKLSIYWKHSVSLFSPSGSYVSCRDTCWSRASFCIDTRGGKLSVSK